MSNIFSDKRKLFGTILGLIMFAITIVSITYAYYSWRSGNTTVTFNIQDNIFFCETNINSSVSSLSPTTDYKDGTYQTFIVKNIGRQDTTFSLTMNVTNISSDVIKDESFKYQLALDPTGGSKNCTTASDCITCPYDDPDRCQNDNPWNGNFANIELGMNTLIQSISLPNNSKYQYYFFMYLDGNMSNPTGIQGASMTSTLGVCDIYVTLDKNTTCSSSVSPERLKVATGTNYGAALAYGTNTVTGLPSSSKSGTTITREATVIDYDINASGLSNPESETITYSATWNHKADGSGATYTDSTPVTRTENHTLYAKWTPSVTSVTLPTVSSRSGYTFMGWYTDTSGGTKVGNAGSTYTVPITSCSHTLHGRWMENNYYNVNTDTYYETLKDAMNSVANNQTIRVLKGITETETITLLGGKTGVKLDMNGKTTTLNGISFVNNGSLDIYSSVDGGVLQGNGTSVINNNGTLTTNSYSDTHTLTIRNTTTYYNNYYVIANNSNKNLTLNDNTTITYNNSSSGTRYLINNQGIFNMNGATLANTISTTASRDRGINCSSSASRVRVNSGTINTGGIGIYNVSSVGTESDPAVLIAGGTITTTGNSVYSSGFLNVTGGSLTSSSHCIYNTASSKATIMGGNISGTNGIYNTSSGIVVVDGSSATITGTSGYGIRGYTGTVTVNDGSVTGSTSGIYITTGSATVNGGTVTGTSQYGAYVYGAGTLTVNGGSVIGKSYGSYNNVAGSTTTISSGNITGNTGIFNKAAGVINVSGTANVTGTNGVGISNGTGDLSISGGTVTGTTMGVYLTSGDINMTNGSITGGTYGISATTGTITMTGGSITGNTNHGVYMTGTGTLTMGVVDLPVSITNPIIASNATTGNIYGVYLNSSSHFNFYDGIVKSKRIDGSINRDNSSITRPNGYYVVKERGSSTEDAYLSNQAYTLTFNSNGGNATVTNGTGSVSVVVNSHSIYPSTITLPTRTATVSYDMGSTGIAQISSSSVNTPLAGWYSAASGGGLLLNNDTSPELLSLSGYTDSNANWVGTSNTTVYAHWSNGSVTLPALSQVGHSCKWHRGSASGTAYNPGAQVNDISANTTFVAVCPPISYEITINGDCGVNNLAATGWTGSPATTIKKSFDYGSTINLASVVTPSFKNGYSDISYTKSSGAGELNGTTFTVGAGIATITAKATALAAPTCSISGGTTKIYNYQDTQLTATNSTSFDSGVTLSYQFGHAGDNNTAFANFENGNVSGSPNKYNVTKALYRGTRYYGTKITATGCNSLSNSCTTATGSGTVMTLKNKKITFNATANGGTLSGTETLYIAYNDANVYTAATNTTTGTIPTASKAGYTFAGWYTTQTTGGVKVINGNGTLVSSAIDDSTSTVWISGSKWANISLSDATLYARFIINSYTVSYASTAACPLPSGSSSTGYDSATVQFGDVINKANPTCTGYDFDGWTLTGGDTSTAKYGTTNNPTTAWVNKNKGTYFKGLASTTGATPTMTANWKAKCYTVTVKAGAGISSLARTGWTGTGTGTLTKELCYGTTDDLSGFTPTYKNGYSGRNNVITSGAGSISGNTFTVGDGVTTITVNATAIETPSCTVGIASTSKIYGASTTALSGSVSNTYDSSISVSYTYYYDTSASGSYTNTQTSPISATSHKVTRYYKAKCVATGEGSLSSNAMSSNHVSLTLNPTKYTLDANSCGTFQGGGTTSDYYVYKGETTLYSNTTGTTTTWPTFNVLSYKELNGWYTLPSNGNKVLKDNGTISGAVSGYTTASAYDSVTNRTLYAQCGNKTFSTTIHYNSNATSGSFTAATVGLSCVAGDDGTCTVTIPSTVTSSKGKYNSTYAGLANAVSRMNTDIAGNATTITLSASSPSDYYAKYSSPLTIYYPNTSGGVSSSNNALYRNEYFSSATAMNTVASNGATSNLQATSVTLSNLKGTFSTLSTTVYNGTGSFSSFSINHSNVINSNLTTYYAVSTESVDVSCAYNSNTASGSFTKATANVTVRKSYYCASTSEVYTSNSFAVPSSISNSKGKYNSKYAGLTTTTNGTISAPNTESTACYAYYSSPLTIYYPNTSGGVSSSNTALYRNEYFSSATAMTTLTSIADDISANYKVQATNSDVSLPNLRGTLLGITPTVNTSTGYMAVNNSGVINSGDTTYYAVSTDSDGNATIYYNSNTTEGGFTPSTATVTGTSTYYCVNTSTQGTNGSTIDLINVPATVRNSVGKWNTPYHGISSAVNSMTLASSMTTGGSYYAVYGAGETTGGSGAVDSNVDEYYSDNNSSGSGYIYSRSYDYTGDIQTFTAPRAGYYKLETWGAQGGNAGTYNGGKGGYSSGLKYLNQGETLYVFVGGKGSDMVSGQNVSGGYNGGGNNADANGLGYGAGGGGATDIRTSSNYYEYTSIVYNETAYYGPYWHTSAGYYQIDIYGSNLDKCTYSAYDNNNDNSGNPTNWIHYNVYYSSGTSNHWVLYVDVNVASVAGLEIAIANPSKCSVSKEVFTKLNDRIIVAGAGGGANYRGENAGEGNGGAGGGLTGLDGTSVNNSSGYGYKYGKGGTQSSGGCEFAVPGTGITNSGITCNGGDGSFGSGGSEQSGGGAGWYGGGAVGHGGAGGGSGYIGTLNSGVTIAGDSSMPKHSGVGSMTGNSNNGYAKITYYADNLSEFITDYSYTGNIQTFIAPSAGYYKLETWGAQGGDVSSYNGGKGGYSSGIVHLNANETIYVVVGGKGSNMVSGQIATGGYNGGGNGATDSYGSSFGGAGGGATHIAKSTGLLSSLSSNQSSVLIVAGAGGGANLRGEGYGEGSGGVGGGLNGDNGLSTNHTNGWGYGYGTGGTQTDAGVKVIVGGTGISSSIDYESGGGFGFGGTDQSGGGAGYYGGGGGGHGGAGGGSGYIGTLENGVTIAGDSSMPLYNDSNTVTGNSGNGFARITKIGKNDIYRNEFFTSKTAMNTVLSASALGTTNITTSSGAGNSPWYGYSTSGNTTRAYNNVGSAANSTSIDLYSIYQMQIFYQKGTNVSEIGATTGNCLMSYSDYSCNSVTPSITPATGYDENGWSATLDDTNYGVAPNTSVPFSVSNQTYYGNATPLSVDVTYNSGNYIDYIPDMNDWSYMMPAQFNVNYDSSTNMNSVTVTTIDGWEQIYLPFSVISGKKYHVSFSYSIPSAYTTPSAYPGLAVQILNALPTDSDNSSSIVTPNHYLPTAVTDDSVMNFEFTSATTGTYYLVFNFGMVSDGSTVTFNLGDFNISYDIAVQHAHYGDNYQVPSPDPTRSGYGMKNNDKWHDEYDHLVNNETTITIPVNHSVIAQWQKNPIITYSSGNIITGMDNIGTTQGESGVDGVHYMEYSITDGVVEVHNIRGAADGFGFTNGRVYLEANRTYRFNAETNGTWSTTENSGQVEAYLLLNGVAVSGVNVCGSSVFCHMDSNSNFEFTPLISGEYWLRLDVNESGGTYTFSNIHFEEIIDRITVPYGGNYILPSSNPTRNENQFSGWYTEENGGGTHVTSSISLVQDTDHTVYANWNKMYHVFLQSQTTDNIWDAYYNEYNGHSNDVTTWGIQPSNQTNYTYLQNATWGDDYLRLDGTNSYGRTTVAYGNQVSSSTYTAEATIMIDSYPSDKGVILSNSDSGGVNFYVDKVGRIVFEYWNGSSNQSVVGSALALNKKYHVAATFNAGVVKLYVNGKLVKQETKSGSSIIHPSTSDGYIFVTLGCDPYAHGCNGSYFNGKIYNFIFHNETTYNDAKIAEDAGLDVGGNSTYGNLPTPVRSGEDFYGWYDSLDFTNQITSSSLYNKTENTTLYAKWRTDLNTTFYDNEFYAPISITNSTSNGLSYSWDSTKNYLTINGTQSSTGSYINATIPTTLAYGDEWDIVLRHVSGSYSIVNNNYAVFVVDAGNGSSNISDGMGTYNVSTRSFIDCVFPHNGSNTCTYAPNVAAGNEAKNIMIWLYCGAANSVTFNNYVVQLDIVKRKTTYYNGTSWNDLAREKNAVVNNGTFTAPSGGNDGYLSLNGTNAWANLGTTTHTNRFTIEADVMLNSVNTSEAYLVSNINSGGYGLKLDSGGKLSACAYIGSSLTCATATTSLSPGVMYKLAGTYNGSNIRAYVNGVEVASVAATGNIGVPTNSTVMAVGANPNGSSVEGSYFNGRVYRIKISNMALPVNRLGQDRVESSTVRYYDVDSVKTHYSTLSEQSGEFYNIPNDVSTSLRGGFDGWRKNTSAYGSVTGSTRVSYNYDHALYANYVGTSVRVVYHLNSGEWAGSTNSTLGTATYVDEGNVSHPGDIVVTHYNGTRNYELYEYGSTVNLYDWNNPNFINISKSGQKGKDGVEWCTQANGGGTCYNQATDYSTNDFCDASSQDCTVNLYVNWVRNFTCGATRGDTTYYADKEWYTISNQNGICSLALKSVSSTVGSYNSASTNLYNEYFTVGSELRKELDANLITSYDTNSGLTTEGLSGNYIYWNNSGSAYHSYYLDNISPSGFGYFYYGFDGQAAWAYPPDGSANLSYVNNPISPQTWTNLNNDSSTLTTLGYVTTSDTGIVSPEYKCFKPNSGSTSSVTLKRASYNSNGLLSSGNVSGATFYFKACGGSYHNANRYKISKKSSTQFNTYNYNGASSNTRNFSDDWHYCFGGNVEQTGSGTVTYNFADDPNCHNYTAYSQSYYSPSIVYRLRISVVT